MFESADLAHSIDKSTYRRSEPKLRAALLAAQSELRARGDFAALLVIGGVDGAGKSETVNLLNAWMDPRYIETAAFPPPSDEERERPRMWRFWRALPPKGKIGILFGAWHSEPILRRAMGKASKAELESDIADIARFERMLTDEGVLLLKLWFHLSKQQQKQRLKSLEQAKATRWRVTPTDWKRFARYDDFRRVAEHFIRQTSTAEAPWLIVPGADPKYRSLLVGRQLLAALRERLDDRPSGKAPDRIPPVLPPLDAIDALRALTLTQPLGKKRYDKALEHWQGKLNLLSRHPKFGNIAIVALFEGNDAAGKGGAIRRITAALDARQYQVIPVAAPTEEERAQPYLWRFWRHLPRRGHFVLFDRSWYGRVLVERVEKLCPEADWARAYGEINDFEAQLAHSGVVLAKFWLALDRDEQLRRFKQREQLAFKKFKITREDWRNRKKWDAYERAVCEMADRTSTDVAPWTLVEANNKYYARIKILRTLCHSIEAALDRV
jgi:polyphosphate:AMP phosphotransferase